MYSYTSCLNWLHVHSLMFFALVTFNPVTPVLAKSATSQYLTATIPLGHENTKWNAAWLCSLIQISTHQLQLKKPLSFFRTSHWMPNLPCLNFQELKASLEAASKSVDTGIEGSQHSPTKSGFSDITVFTRIEEKSSLDVSRILADLDAKCAELTILKETLLKKEEEVLVWGISKHSGSFTFNGCCSWASFQSCTFCLSITGFSMGISCLTALKQEESKVMFWSWHGLVLLFLYTSYC